jgi:hypothetical protein
MQQGWRRAPKAFLIYVLVAATWSFSSFFLHLNPFPQHALLIHKLLIIAAVSSVIVYVRFISVFCNK